ncbi:DUF4238 domain-containing protein [Bradyrhizobium liaoningense]|nr:DUF4238 domain-containing protein [Bradyrhizobium liaoningense]
MNNFTTGGKILAVDIQNGKHFRTNPKNVAQERDFNRVEADGFTPDHLETQYGKFESQVAPILKALRAGEKCSKTEFDHILNLITLLANRNPRHRKTFSEFQDDVAQQVLRLMTATPERWAGQVKQARQAGALPENIEDVPYEVVRDLVANRKLKMAATTSQHAALELGVFEDLLGVIAQRAWRWLHADATSGGFITSDHPVCLFSNLPPKGLPALGYGMTGTTVYFPVSPLLALCGEFDGRTGDYKADTFEVGSFNRRMVNHAHRQIYAANDEFVFFDHADFFDINDLLRRIQQRKHDEPGDIE